MRASQQTLKQQGIMAIITEKKQVFIFDRKYSIAKDELRFLIGRAELTTAQDAKKQVPVSLSLCPLNGGKFIFEHGSPNLKC